MPRVAKEDVQSISHINYVSNSIHDFGDELYEELMERDYDRATDKAKSLIKTLRELIHSMEDEI
jgi:hypothetical protein